MEKITILIVDDHKLIRETWSYILNNDPFSVLDGCGSAEEAIEQAARFRPDVVVMDINLPGMNGIQAIPLVQQSSPGSKILGVSLYSQPSYARLMIQKGAMGYVTKNSSREEMFHALKEIHAGRKYICKEIKDALSVQLCEDNGAPTGMDALSQREIEIIGFIKKGYSSKEMAAALHISAKTAEVHRYNILKKLNLKNSAALVNFINQSCLDLG